MNIETNKRTEQPNYKLDDNDSPGIIGLRSLLAGKFICAHCNMENDNTAWQTLQGYLSSLRLWVEEMGKKHAQSRAKKDLCDNDFSILTGIDMVIGLPQKLITQSEMLSKLTKSRSEGVQENDGEGNEYGDE